MAPAAVDGYFTRTELGLGNLDVIGGGTGTYEIPEENGLPLLDEGDAAGIVATTGSPWMDGESLVHAKLGLAELSMSIDVIAATHAALKTAEAALRATVQQKNFEFHYTLDGTDHGYACMFRKSYRRLWTAQLVYPSADGFVRRVQLVIPRQPNPL